MFDTCFTACSAAIAIGAGTADERLSGRFEPMETGHAERLPGMIAQIMVEGRVSFGDLDVIGVTIGPGSFTGTRVGVAAARAFALATGKPVVGLTSLALMARQAAVGLAGTVLHPQTHICVCVDARRDEVYIQWFDEAGLVATGPPSVLTYSDAAVIGLEHSAVYCGSGAQRVFEARMAASNGTAPRTAAEPAVALFPGLLPDARYGVALMTQYRAYERYLVPLYLRAPDAKPPAPVQLLRR